MGRACCGFHIKVSVVCVGDSSSVKPLVSIVACAVLHLWLSQVKLASMPVGKWLKCAMCLRICWSQLIPPEGVRNQALSSPLRSAALWVSVALPLVCVADACGAPRLNRDLLAEELDLIFPSDPS